MIAQSHDAGRRPDWNRGAVVALVAMFILATWVFIEVADDAPEGDYLEWENQILLSLRQADDLTLTRGPWWLAEAARDVTALGSAVVLTLLTGIVVGFLAMRRRLRTAALVLLATFGGYLLSSGFKSHFGRDRPDVVPHLTEELSLSFPSGHSMVSSATYLTLGALLAQTLARRRERIYFIATALALTGLIGASRVYLGVHYPTDVVAGWAGGTAWAILCWGVAFWLQRRGAIRTPPQEDAAATAAEPAGTR